MKKRLVSILLISTIILSLTGCGSDSETISQLNSISALNSESSVTSNYSLSATDEQEMIYAQVSDRQLLDLSALTACSDSEIQQVTSYMNQVDEQLIGNIDITNYKDQEEKFASSGLVNDNAVIDSSLTDYLLTFMQQTPYYWQRTKTTIRGMDSSTRSIVVDVTYKTIDFTKEVKRDSSIVLGDPNYDTLVAARYNKWITILSTRQNNPNNAMLPEYEALFEEAYGDVNLIFEEQNEYTPTVEIYNTGNQKTYSGLIDSDYEKSGGTMTVRYILVPNYVLGINLGLTCEHMYVTDYQLDEDCTANLSTFTAEGYATVTDSIYSLIYSYFTCLDESDFNGLYSLTNNFATLDKHYQDVFNSTYQKHDGYSISLFDITGTHITCGVTISTKERAKNSNMTYPVYTDRYYMELELVDDALKVDNMILISRSLEGEPAISDEEVDTSGFTATIELDNDDRVAIEKLICNFSAIQLNQDTTSDDFSAIVDTSISTNQLSALKTNMTSLTGVKKVVFLQNYQQGTSNYASVKCKELYQDATNAIVEATATYEFILKGGAWYIYNYDVNSSIKLDTTNLTTNNSLCLVSPGKVESYTSQITGSVSTNLDEVSDISVSFDHKEYTPELKVVKEQGLVLYTGDDVTDDMLSVACGVGDMTYTTLDSLDTFISSWESELSTTDYVSYGTEFKEIYLSAVAYYYNTVENRFSDNMAQSEASEEIQTVIDEFKGKVGLIDSNDYTESVKVLLDDVTTNLGDLGRLCN